MTGIERVEHLWIPLPDGARLGARLWLPAGARPAPAVLEYIPYRKGDATALRDERLHGALAARGYACLRVDLRGSGESDGILLDEYGEQEQRDGLAAIDWIAAQDWCDGSVAMIGKSWGGVIALLLAARRPPALRTVVPVGATDDRYYDDACTYLGGLNGETLGWGAFMLGLNARPPDPAVLGEAWRGLWHARLEGCPHFLETWLVHQRRDDYWTFASLCEDRAAVEIPVFAASGWADCWPNTVPRLLETLSVPRRGIMGPWSHVYPHEGPPGPAIDFVDELDRWFRRWLKGETSESDDAPPYLAWIQEGRRPASYYAERPGFWAGEPAWPSPNVTRQRLHLAPGRLTAEGGGGRVEIDSPQHLGMQGGEYMPIFWFGPAPQLPGEQRGEDANSACFDTAPLAEPLTILGDPRLRLTLACSEPLGLVAARLCDVAPDGASTLITRGVLNLAQREGREAPRPMVPGQATEVWLALNHTGYRLPAGHRLRLALSTAYWPLAWPAPRRFALTLDCADSFLELPLRDPAAPNAEGRLPAPVPPEAESAAEIVEPSRNARRVETDCGSSVTALVIEEDGGLIRLPGSGLVFGAAGLQRFDIHPDDPLSARMDVTWRWRYRREDWQTEIAARSRIACSETDFILDAELQAWEGEQPVHARSWQSRFPRDHF